MNDPLISKLLTERRKRLVASILGHAEREFYGALTPAQRGEFRTKVLTSVDEYTDLIRDLLKVTGEDTLVNDHALVLLGKIHDAVT